MAQLDWTWDELVLAVDLYAREGVNARPSDVEVVALSQLLRALPIYPPEVRDETFRSPSSVTRKLANLASFDPTYAGQPTHSSALDQQVMEAFAMRPAELLSAAAVIKGQAAAGELPSMPEPDEDEVSATEGRLFFRMHSQRERDRQLRGRKLAAVRKAGRPISCECCGFDFEVVYGTHGAGFIECHHLVPLSELGPTKTRLADLVLVCSNCHRMIHRSREWLTPDALRGIISAKANAGR